MQNISIGIITFLQRKDVIKDLIAKIRSASPNVDIMLAINGNIEEEMLEGYRQEMLDLCKKYTGIYPIFCPEFKSVCKLFNTFVIFSKTEYVFIMGDDVEYGNPATVDIINYHIEQSKQHFFKINHGFSHFVCSKTIMHTLGYFDERLCGFGEEDGDITHRYIKMFNSHIPNIGIDNLYNKALYHLRDEKIETHQDNKPRFNREFAKLAYVESPDGICGMNPTPIKKVIPDYQQYPYEQFIQKNKHNLVKFDKVIMD